MCFYPQPSPLPYPSVTILIYFDSVLALTHILHVLASTPHRSDVKTYLENKRGVNMCKGAYFDANAHSARNILIKLSCWGQPPTNCIIDVEFDQHFSQFSEYITIFWEAPGLGQLKCYICVWCVLSKASFLTAADFLVLVEELYSSIWRFLVCFVCSLKGRAAFLSDEPTNLKYWIIITGRSYKLV